MTFGGVEDFVILKSDGTPSYNFAVVVDDADMGVTHVIRGEEHLSNTARQTLLYGALGATEPRFIHLGVILGPDGKKLSKRHGAASIAEYREEGYLPEALVNYLALLGWNHPEGKEEFSGLDEIVARLGPFAPRVEPRDLRSGPSAVLRQPATSGACLLEELRRRLEPFLDEPLPRGREPAAVEAIREEMRTLSDAPRLLRGITGPVDPSAFVERVARLQRRGLRVRRRRTGRTRVRETWKKRVALWPSLRAWAKERGDQDARPLASAEASAHGQEQGSRDGLPLRGTGCRRGAGADSSGWRG